MSWSLHVSDMNHIANIIQSALGKKWNQIPVENALWWKGSEKKSVNFWTLLSYQTNGHHGDTVNFWIKGINKTKGFIDFYVGIPHSRVKKMARYKQKFDAISISAFVKRYL